MDNDPRNLIHGVITWFEDNRSGRGYLRLKFDDGGSEEYQWDEPISAKIDSHSVANLFDGYNFQSIDHDGAFIHVTILA